MHLIEVAPAPCNVCGKGNTADARGDRPRFVDFERDINWNDPLILCEDCIARAGSLVGMASKDALNDLRVELERKDREVHKLKSEKDEMVVRAKRVGVEFAEAV